MASSQLCDRRTPPHVGFRHSRGMKTPQPNTPGARLRDARRAQRWSQEDLAEVMGFSRAHITHMEQNSYRGGRASWEAAARALNVSIDYLLTGRASQGLSDPPAPRLVPPLPVDEDGDAILAELAQQLTDMLRAEGMPSDARTVTRMALLAWRDFEVLGRTIPLQDRIDLVLSEQRSAIQDARTALLKRPR